MPQCSGVFTEVASSHSPQTAEIETRAASFCRNAASAHRLCSAPNRRSRLLDTLCSAQSGATKRLYINYFLGS